MKRLVVDGVRSFSATSVSAEVFDGGVLKVIVDGGVKAIYAPSAWQEVHIADLKPKRQEGSTEDEW